MKPTQLNMASKPIAIKSLVIAVSSLMAVSTSQADVAKKTIGDLEIYQAATGGSGTVTMMLDTSGSMGPDSIGADYGSSVFDGTNCYYTQSGTRYRTSLKTLTVTVPLTNAQGQKLMDDGTTPTTDISYNLTGCPISSAGLSYTRDTTGKLIPVGRYDRISRLKMGLIELFANGGKIAPSNKIGIGNFSVWGGGRQGQIMRAAKPLTVAHRQSLIDYIKSLDALGGTPSAQAYAEAGAYMMGTLTSTIATTQAARGIVTGIVSSYSPSWYLSKCYQMGQLTSYAGSSNQWYGCGGSGSAFAAYSQNGYDTTYYGLAAPGSNDSNLAFIGNPTTLLMLRASAGSPPNGAVYGVLKTAYWPTNDYSGFGFSDDTTKKADKKTYESPIGNGQCDGYGVYFLTDGEPNASSYEKASPLMSKSLNVDSAFTKVDLVNSTGTAVGSDCQSGLGYTADGAWGCMGEYSKKLNSTSNPSGKVIKTAAVGFGSVFSGMATNLRTIKVKDDEGKLVDKSIINCSNSSASVDGRNLCKLAEIKDQSPTSTTGGYGEGGFTATNDPDILAASLKEFVASLVNVTNDAPSGVLTIPNDPYRAIGEMPVAYIPTLRAQLSAATNTSNIWPGNVKKYSLSDGTLYGKSNSKLFLNTKGDLNPATEDLWSAAFSGSTSDPSNQSVKAGGVYSNLKAPSMTSTNDTRKIFVEDLTAANATTTTLRQLSVDTNNKPVGFDTLQDTTTYNRANQIKLLKFMGYEQAMVGTTPTALDALPTTTAIKDMVLIAPTTPVKVLGASVHSKPVAVSYGASLDATTGAIVQSSRDDYVLFGSMDGALHLVDADDYGTNSGGTEKWAIIPRTMMTSQSDAIVPNAKNQPVGVPNFGIDGHWAVDTRYKYDYTTNKVAPDNSVGMSAYGGLRLGGNGLYGLNIATKDNPAIKFFVKPSRMGQIWNRPTFAKIKTSSTDTTGKRVVIVGGGYDTCYEDEAYQVGAASTSTLKNQNGESCATNTAALGNAIYVLDASDGTVLWSVSSSGGTKTHSNMVNSIVASITALDRDNDGFTDQLYAADLGGQLFRVDFKGGVASASTSRVQRILQDEATDKKYVRRFYEQPVVSFYRDNNSKLFAMINVISGDRSSPLSKLRSDNGTDGANADRIYGIIDRDVTRDDASYYGSNNTLSDTTFKDISATSLINVPKQLGTTPQANKTVIINAINTGTIGTGTNARNIYGWYYPLTRFEGYNNVKYTKGIGRSEVIGGLLYTTVYNPDMKYGEDDPCKASIKGGSERQLYCLPYGVCNDAASTNGTGGFMRAGQGIQELALGPRSGLQPNQRLLIGTTTMAEASDPSNRVDFGQDTGKGDGTTNLFAKAQGLTTTDQGGGDGSMAGYIFNERYTLTPNRWYEQTK